ncbi:hypothetical protein ACLB2K_012882 [Fragaria x ananassa]
MLAELWRFCYPLTSGTDDLFLNPGKDPKLAELGCEKVLVCVAEKDSLKDRGWYYSEVLKKSGWNGVVEVMEAKEEDHVFHLIDNSCDNARTMLKKRRLLLLQAVPPPPPPLLGGNSYSSSSRRLLLLLRRGTSSSSKQRRLLLLLFSAATPPPPPLLGARHLLLLFSAAPPPPPGEFSVGGGVELFGNTQT